MLTLICARAQEESFSKSEDIKWGLRKSFKNPEHMIHTHLAIVLYLPMFKAVFHKSLLQNYTTCVLLIAKNLPQGFFLYTVFNLSLTQNNVTQVVPQPKLFIYFRSL